MLSKRELPEAGEGMRGADGHIGYLLRQASVAFRARLDAGVGDFGVTSPQFIALTIISAYPGLSSADLARISLLTPQTIAVIVANLKRADLIAAEPHPIHGRVQELRITAKGAERLGECRPIVDTLEKGLTEGFAEDEMATIRRWLVAAAAL